MAQEGLQLGEHDHGFDSEAFSRSFPLPLRILSLITLGLLGWATNLHFLTRLGIDTTSVLDVRVSEHAYAPLNSNAAASNSLPARHLHPSRLFPPVYKLAAVLALWTFFGLAVYTLAGSHPGEGPLDNIVPIAFASIALLSIFLPVDKLYKQERFMFLR